MRILISIAVATVIVLSGQVVSADVANVRAMVSKLRLPPSPGLPKRVFSVQEVMHNAFIRRHLPSIDINQIRFSFNSAVLAPNEQQKFEDIAAAIKQLLNQNKNEVFLVEGHTDAPGHRRYNLALSAQRAISVRNALLAHYGIPAASLVAVGYGEKFLKVPVRHREARNRRVTVRRITHALGRSVIPATENTDKAKPGFKPMLKQSQALPFTPPQAELPAVIKQPEQPKKEPAAPKAEPDFKPTLKQSQTLPFTPPAAEPPAIIKQPEQPKEEPAAPKADPEFKPTLKQSQALPFTPPNAELPAVIKQPEQPKEEPASPKAEPEFKPTLKQSKTLPFTPPDAELPAVIKQPEQPKEEPAAPKVDPEFKPTLKQSQTLPFTPPAAEPPAIIKQPEQPKQEPAAPKAEPEFKPTLKQSQTLPFTPPNAELPAVIKQPEQPIEEPAALKPEPDFIPTLKQRQMLPFTPPSAELPSMIKLPEQPKAESAKPKVESDVTSKLMPRQMPSFYSMIPPVQPWYMTVPGLSLYSQTPYGQALAWNMELPTLSSGIYVENWQLPTGYRFRLHPGNQRLQDIQFSVEGRVLVIRSQARPWYRQSGGEGSHQAMWSFGDFIQWMSLPADADMNAIRWSVNGGVMEIFIPKSR